VPNDEYLREVDEAFGQLRARIEKLAEQRAGVEAVLYAKDESEEWKRNARLEYELGFEAEYWRHIRGQIDDLIATRQQLVDQQVAKRERRNE
jgi:hypothetical protein